MEEIVYLDQHVDPIQKYLKSGGIIPRWKVPQKNIEEYELTPSTFDKWRRHFETTDFFKEKDNLTPEQFELRQLRKKNKQLAMENDILKQAALIFAQKFK